MRSLIQASWGSKEEFYIMTDRLKIISTNINKKVEYSVKFEEIGFEIVRKQTKQVLWLIPFNLALTILMVYVFVDEYSKGVRFPELLIYVFGTMLFGTMFVYSFFQKTETVYLTGGHKELKINALNPNKETVEQFIKDLLVAVKFYYKTRFAFVDTDITSENNIQNFKWLKEIGAIEDAEYRDLVSKVKINDLI